MNGVAQIQLGSFLLVYVLLLVVLAVMKNAVSTRPNCWCWQAPA